MKKGTKVCWSLRGGASGTGTVITDEDSDGKVMVAVETQTSDEGSTTTKEQMHFVIWCNATWLSVVTP